MDGHTSLWSGRRVLVTGCTGFLGSAVTRELLGRGAVVAGLIRDRAGGAEYTRERDAGQFWPVHGQVEDCDSPALGVRGSRSLSCIPSRQRGPVRL